jgi:RNA polymerase sigma factor for flagellar operon FliA
MRGAAPCAKARQTLSPHELVQQHAPLVKRIAYHLLAGLPASVQADDLIQAGLIGLLEAARRFDPSQGASFETYAGIRIRGSMLDEIRRYDWVPRSVHRKARAIAKALRDIEQCEGRDAEDKEVAHRLGMSLEDYHQALQDTTAGRLCSLDGEDGEQYSDVLSDDRAGPEEQMEEQDMKREVASRIGTLPERERLVLSLYYFEKPNLKEIGEVLGVSESRVCQIHNQALTRLRGSARVGTGTCQESRSRRQRNAGGSSPHRMIAWTKTSRP